MAIEGYFDPADPVPAPYVQARVYLPRLDLLDTVRFLVDTGADRTSLHAGDIDKMRVDLRSLSEETVGVAGVGGQAAYAQEAAYLFVEDKEAGGSYRFAVWVSIACSDGYETTKGLPSLLGRDILNRCRCVIDAEAGQVSIAPHTADESTRFLPLPS